MRAYTVLSLFDGISCGQLALQRAGIEVEAYYASEIDEAAIATTQANFPNTIQLGDIRNLNTTILPPIDLLLGGFPCQDFSLAGRKTGLDGDKGSLFWELIRILRTVNPSYFLFENVRIKKEILAEINREIGVEPMTIDSAKVCAQRRNRLYWFNWKTLQPPDRGILWNRKMTRVKHGFNKGGEAFMPKHPTINTKDRSLWTTTPRIEAEEYEELQTLPRGYTKGSRASRIKQIGNGWTVDVISHILKSIPRDIQ